MARFSEEDRATIWDMREAGVPVKRIAKHLGRQNSSLRRFIADHGGRRPTARERSELRLSLVEREEISRGLAAGWSIRAIAEELGPLALDGVPGGQRQRRADQVSGLGGRPGGAATSTSTRSGPSLPGAGGSVGSSSANSRPNGHPSRSRRGWLRAIRTTRRCRCRTKPSTNRSSSRAVERCAKSCMRVCAPAGPCAGPRPTQKEASARARSATW